MSAKPIMVVGTMSGAGKSLLVAGLCRVFAQDGYRAAPFKSQNMALNSSITATGAEMGRAQVMQAEAAGIEPEAAMNPILLKPTNDTGSQVIVNGQVLGQMSATEYYDYKHNLKPQIMDAYNDLANRFDIIVIEGAGSPAEVNLKEDDIVNMGMAKMAKAPVLLVGDIDRGGVFAQLLGTLMLLDPDEQDMCKALVVNKFRGDKTILDPGLDILRERSGLPIAGVIPYTLLDIDDEDSLSSRLDVKGTAALVDIAVVRLPKISNFTDFIALDAIEGVGVRYVQRATELRDPDLIIIPGTKNTLADLKWMRESGVEAAILKRAAAGTPVFGVCGGYQMLGREVSDPFGAEGGGTMRGMGLLPMRTVFDPAKRQVRAKGKVMQLDGPLAALSGASVEGYEIHMGTTTLEGGESVCHLETESGTAGPDGCHAGNIYGSYLHGIFDSRDFAQSLVEALMQAKGLDASDVHAVDMREYKEQQYDKLAQVIRDNMDMELVYRILDEGVR
ncbi:MAG: cobyric acid synthase [Eggerthellaceae bacterium]|nr:cobyric acid synthase [Eggerthellaceae bacterium]